MPANYAVKAGTIQVCPVARERLTGCFGTFTIRSMASELPNILWICTDQQRYDTVHCLNNPHIHTPVVDRLCAEGVAFTRAYCQSPVCQPSRASFLTGLYPNTVHVNRNGNAYFPANERVRLITRRLADRGYDCGLAGKLHIASC